MTQEEMEEKEAEREDKKNERKRDTANTAQAIRIAANVASASPDPYVGGVAKAIVVADKATGGLSTKIAAGSINRVNRMMPFGKMAQKQINKNVESGAAAVAGMIASKGMDAKNAADTAKNAADAKKAADAAKQTKKAADTAKDAKKAKEAAKQAASNAASAAASNAAESEDKKGAGLLIGVLSMIGIVPATAGLFIPVMLVVFAVSIVNVLTNNTASINQYRTITINSSTNSIYNGTYDLDEYIAGVLAAEKSPVNNLEYYKYRAIEVRTEFLKKADSNVVGIGNEYMDYISVDESPHQDTIETAVEATAGKIVMSDNPLEPMKIVPKVTKIDNNNYYIEYKSPSSGLTTEITISNKWQYILHYIDNLEKSYSSVSTSEDYHINDILALYLISSENYTYEDITKEYYENANIVDANLGATGAIVSGFITPLEKFSCSNGFGCRFHPIDKAYRLHTGVDLGAKSGELIYAAKSGKITEVETGVPGYSSSQGYGNYITIAHDDGSQTRYAHMLYGSIPSTIYVGARVTQGEIIGKVGSTGKSTGPHLHYEIFINGDRVNPYYYMDFSNVSNNSSQCNSNANVPMSKCGF